MLGFVPLTKMQLSRFVSLCPAMTALRAVPGWFPGASCVRKLYTSLALRFILLNRNNRNGAGTPCKPGTDKLAGPWHSFTCPEDNARWRPEGWRRRPMVSNETTTMLSGAIVPVGR
jgi:hypothetical protein